LTSFFHFSGSGQDRQLAFERLACHETSPGRTGQSLRRIIRRATDEQQLATSDLPFTVAMVSPISTPLRVRTRFRFPPPNSSVKVRGLFDELRRSLEALHARLGQI